MGKKLLLLSPPSYADFDGGAGARYQASREVASFWYPIWLCYPAGMVEGSRVVDAPADDLNLAQTLEIAKSYDLVLIYTSTPSLPNDANVAGAIKKQRPETLIGFCGPHPTVQPEETLRDAPAIDFVTRDEFDYSIKEIAEGRPLSEVRGISWRAPDGVLVHNPKVSTIEDLDALPWVSKIYKRDLKVENYNIPWIKYPYLSIYTTRGCPAQCTYCLWPQTTSGHTYRKRSVADVVGEFEYAVQNFPQVNEIFFDDDTFSFEKDRTREIAKAIGKFGKSWGGNARGNLDYETLKVMKDNGCRVLMVGYETGSDEILKNVKKGIRAKKYVEFTRDAKKAGIMIHGAFILGLPGETPQTIDDTIDFACALDPDTIQVSLAAPYPGTEFYEWAKANGYLAPENELIGEHGYQDCKVEYPEISSIDIFKGVEKFYKKFYFRPSYMMKTAWKMLWDSRERKRLLREGKQFKEWMQKRQDYLRDAQKRIANRREMQFAKNPTRPGRKFVQAAN
ncbi:MAG TPA: hopanoid biosynthesis associated radical SAM protein HpnJ [Planctomycetota bacterium]|nr:hopanoid biosynthesis associated radical SAM protein HpnJ [Planctomycetota bacterium]